MPKVYIHLAVNYFHGSTQSPVFASTIVSLDGGYFQCT